MFFSICLIVFQKRLFYRGLMTDTEPRQTFGFLFVDGFALMSSAAAIEPLRVANLLSANDLFEIRYLSRDGGRMCASCGASFDTTALTGQETDLDILFVVAGGNPMSIQDPSLFGKLRTLAVHGTPLGGISGGAVLLAKAGVLDGRRFTVHWEHFEELRALSDRYLMERRLFIIDRDRYTCAGGVAPLDMMHALIQAAHGTKLAQAVSDWCIHTGVRSADDPQRSGFSGNDTRVHTAVLSALELMENHIADPLSLDQIAMLTGLGSRQLSRRFEVQFGKGVMQCYMDIRLQKADELIRKTRLPVVEVAMTTGFINQAHFARVYRTKFGASPSVRRKASST